MSEQDKNSSTAEESGDRMIQMGMHQSKGVGGPGESYKVQSRIV